MIRLLIAAAALAAGLPARAADAVVPIEPTPGFSWTGGYVGGSIGYGWGSVDVAEGPLGAFAGLAPGDVVFSTDPQGVFGGVVAGYNWQFGNIVAGIEGTFSLSDIHESDVPSGITLNDTDLTWLATIGPRVGHAFDRVLVYGEGGYAVSNIDFRSDAPGDFFEQERTHHGGYVGAGVDWAVRDQVIVGLNYKYIMLEDKVHGGIAPLFGPVDVILQDVQIHTISGRALFKF